MFNFSTYTYNSHSSDYIIINIIVGYCFLQCADTQHLKPWALVLLLLLDGMMIECLAGWMDGVNEHLIYTCSVLRSESTAAHLPFSGLRQEWFQCCPLPWELFSGKQIEEEWLDGWWWWMDMVMIARKRVNLLWMAEWLYTMPTYLGYKVSLRTRIN